MRIAIVGAGAIGCAYGYRLAESGAQVTLVDTWAEHVRAISQRGLVVQEPRGERTIVLAISTELAAVARAEAVLVAVKSFANEALAEALRPVLTSDAIVLTVQNGIGNVERLAAVLGRRRVVQGSTTVGGEMLSAGRLRVVAGTVRGESLTVLGRPPDAAVAAVAQRLADSLRDAGLPTEVRDDVRDVVWRKAILAAAIGPLCATLGVTVTDALARPTAAAALRRAVAEIVAVARAEGLELDAGEVWQQAGAVYRSVGDHSPSLAVDVAHGRRTEVDAQLGEICRRAAAAGIPTPACDVLAGLVRSREPGRAGDTPPTAVIG